MTDLVISSASRSVRRQERARTALRGAAKRAFERNGYTKATVQHILDEADVVRRTFYRYFSSKEDVFAELLETLVDELCASITVASDEPSLRARLRARAVAMLKVTTADTAFLRTVNEAIRVNDDHARRWARLRETLEEQHRQAFAWCIRHGIMDDSDTTLLSKILTGMIGSVLLDAAVYDGADTFTIESTIVDLYWNMLFGPHEGADDYLLDRRRPLAVFDGADRRRVEIAGRRTR